jgi:hypothetical protein
MVRLKEWKMEPKQPPHKQGEPPPQRSKPRTAETEWRKTSRRDGAIVCCDCGMAPGTLIKGADGLYRCKQSCQKQAGAARIREVKAFARENEQTGMDPEMVKVWRRIKLYEQAKRKAKSIKEAVQIAAGQAVQIETAEAEAARELAAQPEPDAPELETGVPEAFDAARKYTMWSEPALAPSKKGKGGGKHGTRLSQPDDAG